jgi:hypothetical protein
VAVTEESADDIWKYGFRWGPLTVTRLAHIDGRGYVIEVATDHQVMQVHITEKGNKINPYPVRKA